MKIIFLFEKKPEFPVICNFNNTIVSFLDENDMKKRLFRYGISQGESYDIIDVKVKDFILSIREEIIIVPAFFNTRWTKQKLIDLCNNRKNRRNGPLYVPEKPESKRMTELIAELAVFINRDSEIIPRLIKNMFN